MKPLVVRDPSEYARELPCPRCGNDGTGHAFPICADRNPDTGERWSHDFTCRTYRYSFDLCAECEVDVLQETSPERKALAK